MTKHQLTLHRRLHRDVYISRGTDLSPLIRAQAASTWGGPDGVLAGFSAAAVLGSKWIDDHAPAELIRSGSRRSVPGITVHADTLLPGETVIRAGMRITSPARTAFDLGRWLNHDHAVEVLDALCAATGLSPDQILQVIADHPRTRGNKRLRNIIRLLDAGAQSPPETRTRLSSSGPDSHDRRPRSKCATAGTMWSPPAISAGRNGARQWSTTACTIG
ncbi:hypothetical protein [Tomitella biformata]|uniref:hypothetical protein n=1 Tax=Tomitella biformata TaxID=630403 RepID=UPI001F2D6EDD|nr:hypothetical protein [Tomitella biformata]